MVKELVMEIIIIEDMGIKKVMVWFLWILGMVIIMDSISRYIIWYFIICFINFYYFMVVVVGLIGEMSSFLSFLIVMFLFG